MMSLRWGLTARFASHQHFAAVVDTDDFFAFGTEPADPVDDLYSDFLAGADKRNARGIGDDGTGADSASCLLERHEFLAEVLCRLGVPREVAEEDACKIEHDLSQTSFDRMRQWYSEHQDGE